MTVPVLHVYIRRCLEAKASPVVSQLLEMLDAASQRLRLVCGLFGEEVRVRVQYVNLSMRPHLRVHAGSHKCMQVVQTCTYSRVDDWGR